MNPIMTIRPPDKMQVLLKKIAQSRGLTANALVIQILWDWLKDNGKEGWPDASVDGRQGAPGLVRDVRDLMEGEE